MNMKIGQIAKQAKCKVETVHYYEKSGLMPKPPRTVGGHRIYSLPHVKEWRLNNSDIWLVILSVLVVGKMVA